MAVHIYQQGKLSKKADEGLTFEQQMGTMTSARVGEQFPMLAPYLVGFELLDKDEDGTYGVGTMVYMMGNQAFYIPSFYNHGRMKTGEIIVLGDQQQFIPATERIISYMKARYDKGAGIIFPALKTSTKGSPGSVKVKDDSFPIRKQASCGEYTVDMLQESINMGKQAAAQVIDIITADARMFNEFVDFYGMDKVASFKESFQKQFTKPHKPVNTWVMDPMDKTAAALDGDERKMLNTFGFLIKTAKRDFSDIIKEDSVSDQFSSVTTGGVYELLDNDGELHKAVVIATEAYPHLLVGRCCTSGGFNKTPESFLHPFRSKRRPDMIAIFTDDNGSYYAGLKDIPVGRRISEQGATFQYLESIGTKLEDTQKIQEGSLIVTPSGSSIVIYDNMVKAGENTWVSSGGYTTLEISDVFKKIRDKGDKIQIPEGAIIIKRKEVPARPENMSWEDWDLKRAKNTAQSPEGNLAYEGGAVDAIARYMNKHYTTVKIFSNGSGFTVSDGTGNPREMSIKEASFTLTNKYNVDPMDAPYMVLDAYPKDGVSNNSTRWCITKSAAGGDYSRGASEYDIPNMGYNEVSYDGPQVDTIGADAVMPAQGKTREQILEQVQKASDSGIKEIFDVSLMKVLVKTSRPESLLGDYRTTIIKMMDRLCRMLFLGYTQEDSFKEQFGEDKYEDYMETIRNAMKDLSELFIFVTTRSVIEDTMSSDGSDELVDGAI